MRSQLSEKITNFLSEIHLGQKDLAQVKIMFFEIFN